MASSYRKLRTTAFRARTALNKGRLWVRGYDRMVRPIKATATRNVYFATVQRSGSQWLKAIFADDRIQDVTGLQVYPQHRYEWNEFKQRFPPYTFVPGLYMSYDLYEEISRPEPYRTIYVLRDPRNIALSWYWAAKDTHVPMGKIDGYRRDLRQLDLEDGIAYSIRALAGKFTDIRTWMYHRDDPHVRIVRFEELTSNPESELTEVFSHCRLPIQQELLLQVMQDYTKKKMRSRDLQRQPVGVDSHYRARSSDHRDMFSPRHYELFEQVTGDLLDLTGYR